MDKIVAPFTKDQVESLNEFQKSGFFHPFTGQNELAPSGQDDILIATEDGWISQYSDYHQTWAWDFMANWAWKEVLKAFRL